MRGLLDYGVSSPRPYFYGLELKSFVFYLRQRPRVWEFGWVPERDCPLGDVNLLGQVSAPWPLCYFTVRGRLVLVSFLRPSYVSSI